jgi:hypothetical protein
VATFALVAFGLVSSAVLLGVGGYQAATRRYRGRDGVVREGAAAVRAGLLVALIGGCELALTLWLWGASR